MLSQASCGGGVCHRIKRGVRCPIASGNQTLIRTNTGIWSAEYNAQNRAVRYTRENSDGTRIVIGTDYDAMGRRAWKKVETVTPNPETGEETTTVLLNHRYIYRGYLQIATCDRKRAGHPCLWLITWDPTQPIATRPLAIQKDSTWYCYGWDLTKNICEIYSTGGYISTVYTYTPLRRSKRERQGYAAYAMEQRVRRHGMGAGVLQLPLLQPDRWQMV